MNVGLSEPLQRLVATHERGGHVLVLADYDGTLVPLVDHPDQALLPERTRQALIRLARTPRVFVGIFSGRELANLRRIVGIPELYYAGTNGLEIDFGGSLVTHPQVAEYQPALVELGDRIGAVLQGHAGAWLERKPFGLTVHYRALAAEAHSALFAILRNTLAPYAERLRALPGPMAVEITPALDWHKGTAVERFHRGILLQRNISATEQITLYAGDGDNDREAFDSAAALGGITVGVGAAATEPLHWRVESPMAFGELLDKLATALVASRRGMLFSSLWNWQIATLKCSDLKCF